MARRLTYIVASVEKAVAFEWLSDSIDRERFDLSFILLNPGRTERLTDEGQQSRFTADGGALLYYVNLPGPAGQYWLLDLDTLEKRQITLPSVAMIYLRLLPDGEHAVYHFGPPPEADIWLLEIEEGR